MSLPSNPIMQELNENLLAEPVVSSTWKTRFKRWQPFVIGILLLALMTHWVGWQALGKSLANAQLIYVLPALLFLTLSGLVAGWRWHTAVVKLFHLQAEIKYSLRWYLESMSLASIVPGAQATGDVWRTVKLYRMNSSTMVNDPSTKGIWLECLYSVMWDRAIGLWSMFAISLVATLILNLVDTQFAQTQGHLQHTILLIEALVVLFSPCVLISLKWLPTTWQAWRFLQPWCVLQQRLFEHPWVTFAIVLKSMVVLGLTAITWGLALKAIHADCSILVGIATAAPIFVAAALPVSMGGWGTREIAAIQMMENFGFSAVDALSASVVLGGIYTIFALMVSPLFLWRSKKQMFFR